MNDRGTGAHGEALGNILGISSIPTSSEVARSRRRLRIAALVVVLFVAAGGYAVLSRTQEAVWYLPAGYVAEPASTSVDILVMELACSSGATPEVAKPQVKMTAATVTISVRTRQRLWPSQSCPGPELGKVRVDFGEPLGDRQLVDAYGDLNKDLAPLEIRDPRLQAPLAAQR